MSSPSPEHVVHVLDNIPITSYFNAASVVVLLYDYLLTFSDEVNYVWRKSITPVSILFYITHYLPFFDTVALFFFTVTHRTMSTHAYQTVYKMQIWSYAVGITITNIILLLRTTSIWAHDRTVAAFLSMSLTSITIPIYYFISRYLTHYQYAIVSDASNHSIIIPTHANKNIIIAYALSLSFEFGILSFTLFRALGRENRFNLYQSLYNDSLMFYVYIIVISLTNVILMVVGPVEIASSLLPCLHRVLLAIFSARMIINVRSEANPGTSPPLITGDNLVIMGKPFWSSRTSIELQDVARQEDDDSEIIIDDDVESIMAFAKPSPTQSVSELACGDMNMAMAPPSPVKPYSAAGFMMSKDVP